MIKVNFLVMLFMLISMYAAAQRHIKGIKSVEAGYGLSRYGSFGYGSFVMYTDTRFYGKATLYYEQAETKGLPMTSMGITITGNYTVLPIHEKVFINITGGLVVSNDKLNKSYDVYDVNGNASPTTYATLKYGVLGGIEAEVFLSDKFVLITGFNQRMVFNSDNWGKYRWYSNLGIRYNF